MCSTPAPMGDPTMLCNLGSCPYLCTSRTTARIGGASVDCRTFLLVQSKGAKMAVMNLFRILSPVKLNESVLE